MVVRLERRSERLGGVVTYDIKDFRAQVEAKAKKRQSTALPAMRALQAAGVIMAKLTTGSDEWNRYLSYLQGKIDQTRDRREVALKKMSDAAVWDPQQLTKLKSDILQADAMIAAWEWAMLIPKALVDGGAEATEFLAKMEGENGKGSDTEAA